jgi:hypothetical protein
MGLFFDQKQPNLVLSCRTSPAVFTVIPDAANNVVVTVQTVLNNGQSLPLPQCPVTAFTAYAPVPPLGAWGPVTPASGWTNTGSGWFTFSTTLDYDSTAIWLALAGSLSAASYANGTIGHIPGTAPISSYPTNTVTVPVVINDATAGTQTAGLISISTSGVVSIASSVPAGHSVSVTWDGLRVRLT